MMISLALAALLLAAFATVHARTRQATARMESLVAVQDSAIQAMAYITADLRQAGFRGLGGLAVIDGVAGPGDPVVLPVAGDCGSNFAILLDRPVEGRNGVYNLACPPRGSAGAGADVLILRRLSASESDPESGRLQAGLSLQGGALFIDTPPANPVEIRDLVSSVYYVSRNSLDSPPALRRKTLVKGPRMLDEEIAPGIADFQIQFGIDLDGLPPVGADAYVHPDDPRVVQPGVRIVAVRVWLLSEESAPPGTVAPVVPGYADRPTLPAVPRRSRHLLVQTVHLPNAGFAP
jgi:hypothetical protein